MQYACSLLSACPGVTLAGKASTQDKAVELIDQKDPDLLLLDVELHGGNGFEVMRRTAGKKYNVVFTTALYDKALDIIRLSGVSVLQKPLDYDELKNILENFNDPGFVQLQNQCLRNLIHTLQNDNIPATISLDCCGVLHHLSLKEILKAELINGTIIFTLENGKSLQVKQDIKHFELLLRDFGFFRVNANAIVNLQQIKPSEISDDHLSLRDDSTLFISPKKKEAFKEALQKFNKG